MKRKFLIVIVILIIVLSGILALKLKMTTSKDSEIKEQVSTTKIEDTPTNVVVIENNKIENEILIDEFIDKATYSNSENQELNIIQDDTNIKLTYTSGEYAIAIENESEITPAGDGTFEDNKRVYGYYSLFINDNLEGEYPLVSNSIKRITENDNVILYFYAALIDYATIPQICSYSLNSSNYTTKYELSYIQRKDLGIKEVGDNGEYKIKTFGGDVELTVEDDMVYTLDDAIKQGIITCDDILNQCKIDEKYGKCEKAYYSDGGSTEYLYNDYTILKLNTLNGDKDLIIGMHGQIINSYENNKE